MTSCVIFFRLTCSQVSLITHSNNLKNSNNPNQVNCREVSFLGVPIDRFRHFSQQNVSIWRSKIQKHLMKKKTEIFFHLIFIVVCSSLPLVLQLSLSLSLTIEPEHHAMNIITLKGMRPFFKGIVPTVLRDCIFGGVYSSLKFILEKYLRKRRVQVDGPLSTLLTLFACFGSLCFYFTPVLFCLGVGDY